MIPPGLLVAVTLASAHAPSPGLGSEAMRGSPARSIPKADPAESTASGGFGSLLAGIGMPAPDAQPGIVLPVTAPGPRDLGLLAAMVAVWPGIVPTVTPEEATRVSGETEVSPPRDEEDETQPLGVPLEIVAQQVPPREGAPILPSVAAEAAPDTVTLDPRMTRGLSRGFVSRLGRVAERLWNEHGLRLEVVEGFRSQARQAELFTQGRTEPGAVVTWTTSSLHTAGQAADVFIGGAPVSQQDALLLARIARDEGLRTLYPLDSGHIQLDGPGGDAGPEGPLERRLGAPVNPIGAPRRGVAPVAPVAPVAEPARVDGVVVGDAPKANDRQAAPVIGDGATPEVPRAAGPVATVALERAERRDARKGGPGDSGANAAEPNAAQQHRRDAPPAVPPLGPARLAAFTPDGALTSRSLDPARLESPLAPPSFRSVHLPMEGLGQDASLQVGLRGATVDARLSVSDPLVAAELREAFHELRQQLGRRGLDSGDLAVRLVAQPMSGEVPRSPILGDPRALHAASSAGGTPFDPDSPQGRLPRQGDDPTDVRERGSRTKRDPRKET